MQRLAMFVLISTLLLSACGGGDSGSNLPTGRYAIDSSGGNGGNDGAFGGNGGAVNVVKEGGAGGVALQRSGEVDAAWTPTAFAAALGATPLYVSGDVVVPVATSEPPAGTPYTRAGDQALYLADGDGNLNNDPRVTGIAIAPGARLTLAANLSPAVQLLLTGDIDNRGTLATADVDAGQRAHLQLTLHAYGGGGAIETAGHLPGQNGGNLFLSATDAILNSGALRSAGADSTAGAAGNGGNVELYAQERLENRGAIVANGGTAAAGSGGAGGYADLVGYYGLSNDGAITTRGGAGTSGGNGGWIWLEAYTRGAVRNRGACNAAGGEGRNGAGGRGGDVDLYAYGGELLQQASIDAGGGAAGGSGSAGAGGYVSLGTFKAWNLPDPAGDLHLSGDIVTRGGSASGGDGGAGGPVDVYLGNYAVDDPTQEQNQRLELLGYRSLTSAGGSGNYGGSGGNLELLCDYGYRNPAHLVNEADLDSRGGSVVAGARRCPAHGGKGGDVYLEVYRAAGNSGNPLGSKLVNAGAVNASGGENLEADGSVLWGGGAGYVLLYGAEGLANRGPLAASGGHDRGSDGGATGIGGNGNWIVLFSDGSLVSHGTCSANGGAGEYRGGRGGEVHLTAAAIDLAGSYVARGGDASSTLFGAVGGDGGLVEMAAVTRTGSASTDVAGGRGTLPGGGGVVIFAP